MTSVIWSMMSLGNGGVRLLGETMQRWWLALLLVLAWCPTTATAQGPDGPTPYEVAQAMLPCLAGYHDDGAPLMIGTRFYANIMGAASGPAATEVVMSLDRRPPDREMREMRDIDFY